MKTVERIVMVLLLFILIGGSAWIYFAVTSERQDLRDAVTRGDFEIRNDTATVTSSTTEWRRYYPVTRPIAIAGIPVLASIADTVPERIKGLSNTPFLPENVVKLFVFGVEGPHSIWMKDMNYAIDILWATREGEIVHIEENVAPETFPESFASPVPAWYVIETNAGFVSREGIEVGDPVTIVSE